MQPAAPLSPAQRRRYARQLSLREIGEAGQRTLCAARPELPAGADPEAARVALDYLTRAGLATDAPGGAVDIDVPGPSSIEALAGQPSLRVAASALAGAFAAVEAIKALTGTGQSAKLSAELRLSPELGLGSVE